jgi:NAD(P)-dependent dehydrogenase (short-subunit alcohol dehydrogenase family)
MSRMERKPQSLKGKTVLITGSTDGIGKQTSLRLACQGASVILHGRDIQRLQKAREEIALKSGSQPAAAFLADFGSLAQVKTMADQIIEDVPRLDVLINNAGVFSKQRVITEDGLEISFQVNHLSPFLLTNLLLPLLIKSAPSRIVTVTSSLHSKAILDFDNLQSEKNYDGIQAYALSKLGNIFMTLELAERLADMGVTANCVHPGGVDTKMLRTAMGIQGIPVEDGAEPSIFLASSNALAGVSGKYFYHREIGRYSEIAGDSAARKKFWQVSENLLHNYLP